jgi:hypothetical protein
MTAYAYRWVRKSIVGAEDKGHLAKRGREGWEPVPVDDPNRPPDDSLLRQTMTLMRQPAEKAAKRKAYYESKPAQMLNMVVESYARDSDPRMQKFAEIRAAKGNAPTGKRPRTLEQNLRAYFDDHPQELVDYKADVAVNGPQLGNLKERRRDSESAG